METAKVFTNGRSQAVRIPKRYRLTVDEVFINKIGDALILTPTDALAKAFDVGAAMLTDDFLSEGVPKSISVDREDL